MSTDKDKQGPKVTIKQKGRRVERDPAKGAEEGRPQREHGQPRQEAQRQAQPARDDGRAKDLKEQMARLQADFTNFKRRVEQERIQTVQDAHGDLATQLLPVVDNFDRAAEHVPEAVSKDPWYAGIEGIRKQFADILAELGIERIEAVGRPFDPELHEAVGHEPSEEHDKNVVSKEFEAGYRMGEKVVRPAKVQVSSGKEK